MKWISSPARWARDPFAPLLLLALALSVYKVGLLEATAQQLFACRYCLAGPAALHEAQFLLVLAMLHLAAGLPRALPAQCTVRLLAAGSVLIMAADLLVLKHFWTRLTAYQLQKFISEPSAIAGILQQLSPRLALEVGLLALVLLLVCGQYVARARVPGKAGHLPLGLSACVTLIAASHLALRLPTYHEPYVRNALQAFFQQPTRERPYSAALAESARRQASPPVCHTGLGQHLDVILLVVESLSVYQSRRFSGLNDWTPQLDALSDRGLRYTGFRANGVSSEEGLVSLLTGEPAIPRPEPRANTTLEQFGAVRETVPRMLHGLGYKTEFLTTGDLGFLDKGPWLDAIGFDYREGHEARFYQGMPRFHFDAAPDEALYDRALQELQRPRGQPLFMTLETVSSHHPYVQPVTGERTPEAVFRYADAQIGRFVAQLKARGYFKTGVLLITGDHRAMTPMTAAEQRLLGDRAYARIPLVVLGDGLHGEVPDAFSQSDFKSTLRFWLGSGPQCIASNQGVFLPTVAQRPDCVFTRRPYAPDLEVAECGKQDYHVILDGDNTRFDDPEPGPAAVITQVHRLRLGEGY